MFLATMRRRNPALISAAARLHADGRVPAGSYVVDLDTVAANARLVVGRRARPRAGVLADDEAVRPQPAGRAGRRRRRRGRRRGGRDGRGARPARARAAHRARRPPRPGAASRAGRGALLRARASDRLRRRPGRRGGRRRPRRRRRPAAAAPSRPPRRPLLRGPARRRAARRRARRGRRHRRHRRRGAGRCHDLPLRGLGRRTAATSSPRRTWTTIVGGPRHAARGRLRDARPERARRHLRRDARPRRRSRRHACRTRQRADRRDALARRQRRERAAGDGVRHRGHARTRRPRLHPRRRVLRALADAIRAGVRRPAIRSRRR